MIIKHHLLQQIKKKIKLRLEMGTDLLIKTGSFVNVSCDSEVKLSYKDTWFEKKFFFLF